MAVSEYVKDCVACSSIFGFLRSHEILILDVVHQLSATGSDVIVRLFAIRVVVLS